MTTGMLSGAFYLPPLASLASVIVNDGGRSASHDKSMMRGKTPAYAFWTRREDLGVFARTVGDCGVSISISIIHFNVLAMIYVLATARSWSRVATERQYFMDLSVNGYRQHSALGTRDHQGKDIFVGLN